ncbi:MAG TPA: nitroreductase family protein [Acidobacteriota bacterium]|nr:nitroreductase family protein [Acidobacteriota bacterium]
MTLKKLIESRYATKLFSGETIDEKKINEIKEAMRLAPSGFNIQPWKIKVVTDQKIKDLLTAAAWNQPQVKTASHVFVICADTAVDKRIDELVAGITKKGAKMEHIQAYVDMMRGWAKQLSQADKTEWAKRQTFIPLSFGMLAAKELGYDSCPMEGFSAADFSKILKLPANLVPTVLMPVGVAADTARPKFRFDSKDVFS